MKTIVIELYDDVEDENAAIDEVVTRIKEGYMSGSDVGFSFEVTT